MPEVNVNITGYRQLSDAEQAQINAIKEVAETVRVCVESVQATPGADKRWAAIAATDLQKGFMALVRAIAQPTTF